MERNLVNSKKLLTIVAGGVGAASLVLAATLPTAQADPVGPPEYRALAGMGSDTTMDLMNALSEVVTVDGVKVIASYNAIPDGPPVTTKNPATDPLCVDYPRANGSSSGRDALQASLQAGDNCLQFARSSSGRSGKETEISMAWVPYATDNLTFAVNTFGTVPAQLSKAEIVSIFKCESTDFQPALVQTGSGTRSSWLKYVGITEDEIASGTYPCLVPVADGGTFPGPLPQEHDGRTLKANQIMPYSASVWQAQMWKAANDRRGDSVLGVIDGVAPTVNNGAFSGVRSVYNIIPSAKADDPSSLEYQVFVGPNSLICQGKPTINLQGFGDLVDASKCGDASDRS
jgi:ABC-type phosphate transport system substrate-binding protein